MKKKALIAFVATLLHCHAKPPLALHQLIEVDPDEEVVLNLHGLDFEGDATVSTITSLPKYGTLYQLSYIFSKHGYEPKTGEIISSVPVTVNGSNNRIVYRHDSGIEGRHNGEWGRFQYIVADDQGKSKEGTVVLVPPSHVVVESDFFFSSENWTTVGNRQKSEVIHEQSSRGKMRHYIYAVDNSLNIDAKGDDLDVWYFELPSKFHGWQGIMYEGKVTFDMSSFGGDFSEGLRNKSGKMNIIEISCAKCSLMRGETIGFPLETSVGFDGKTQSFSIDLHERAGWKRDPKNSLHNWEPISKCAFIEMLSGISSVRILGDFTRWYESISIDNVRYVAAKPRGRHQLPVCAQKSPDARRCDCDD